MITQARLKELFAYDPETGWLTNRVTRNPNAKEGMRAGTVSGNGYRQIAIGGTIYLEHRVIWMYIYGVWPEEIDHINGIRNENSLVNLREATRSENRCNTDRPTGTSGLRGVSPNKSATGWRARIWVDGQEVSLGEFETAEEASAAYLAAAELHYGEFAFHNRPTTIGA